MKRKLKLLALCLALVQLLLLFAACGGEEAKTTGATPGATTNAPAETPTTQNNVETPTTQPTTTEEVTTEPLTPEGPARLCLVENGEACYTIVNSISANSTMNALIQEFRSSFEETTGVSLQIDLDSDAPESDAELVFGARLNRPDVAQICSDTAYFEARMQTSEGRIVFSAYSEKNYETLCTFFLRALYEEDGCWYVDVDMINFSKNPDTRLKQPHYDTASGRLQGFGAYTSMENTTTVTYTKTNREEFEAYQEKLIAQGFTKHTENQIGTVEFVTYVNLDQTIHLQFRADVNEVTINFFRGQYVPAAAPAEYTAVTRSSVNYITRYGFEGWGLSMIVQLADGTYIIVDGGKSHATDRANMIKFMQDNKPASHEKPIVSLWLLTHPHEDHVEMFAYDAAIFAQSIELKMLGYNFPIEPCSEVDATGRYWNEYYHHAIEAKRAAHFPDAQLWTAHTGQKLYLADAEIEILYTHEDYYPGEIYSANDCNTCYRISVDGVDLIVLGDSDRGNAEMTEMYGEALLAEMVQASHHGLNGPAAMYIAMDPKVVFWPDCRADIQARWELACNKPWVHVAWQRGEETGERAHYTSTETTRIYFDQFKE